MCLNVSRAESVSACIGTCLGPVIFLLSFYLLRAGRVSLLLANIVSARAESLVCTCICWFVVGAARHLVSVGQYQELSMNVHVSVLLEIQS